MMTKKIILITGSALIGIISMLAVIFTLIGTGTIDVEQKTLVFTSDSAETTYSGDALTASGWEITSGQLKEGHIARVVVDGSQTVVGTSLNTLSATIVDEKGADVTDHYQIEYHPGTLKVFHRNLQIMANDAVKTYDGSPLTCNQYTIISGSLPAGHRVEPTYTGSITDVGTAPNTVSVIIKDPVGTDVTSNYNINTLNGNLVVVKRTVHFQSDTVESYYNGTALTSSGASITDGTLVSGHTMMVDAPNSIINVGSIENSFTVRVYDSKGTEVSSNYDLVYSVGTLTIKPTQVTITTESDVKPYDGTPLKNDGWDITVGSIVDGETLTVIMNSEITQVGNVKNEPIISVTNAAGDEIAGNYDFTIIYGSLTVTSSAFTLVSKNDEQIYNGSPLTCEEGYVAEYSFLPEGHYVEYDFTGSITSVGEAKNYFTAIIRNEDGIDVTASFDISYSYGTLKVTKRPIAIETDTISKDYDGITLFSNGNWNIATGYSLATGDAVAAFTFTGSQLKAGSTKNSCSFIIRNAAGEDVTSFYDIKNDYIGTLTVNKTPLSLASKPNAGFYNGKALTCSGVYYAEEGQPLVAVEYFVPAPDHTIVYTMTGSQTTVGTSENKFTVTIFNKSGDDVTENFNIKTSFATLTVNKMALTLESATATEMYNGSAFTKPTVTLKTGTIAAGQQFVPVVTGTITDVGTTDNKFSVTIEDDYRNDYSENYEITLIVGKLTVTKRNDGNNNAIIFRSPTPEPKTYDGTPLKSNTSSIIDRNINLAFDHSVDETHLRDTLASITNVGEIANTYEIIIRDKDGKDVTSNYDLKLYFGTLKVVPLPVEFESDTLMFEYDGNNHYGTKSSVHLKDGSDLALNHFYSVEMITESGYDYRNVVAFGARPDNKFSIKILSDNEDVSSNYKIITHTGKIHIYARASFSNGIYFQSPNQSKIYNGAELKTDYETDYWIMDTNVYSYLLDNHTVTYVSTASITNVGEKENTFTVSIKDENQIDVTSNYSIEPLRFGTLTVSHRPIQYTSDSANKIYDAQPLTKKSGYFTVNDYYYDIPSNHSYFINYTESITNVGTVKNEFTIEIFDEYNNPVTSNYVIDPIYNELQVVQADIKFISGDYKKDYDGKPLTNDPYTDASIRYSNHVDYYGNYSLASYDHYFVSNFTASITNAGTTENKFTITIYDRSTGQNVNVTDNYNIECISGTLTVTKRHVVFESENAYRDYDGTPLTTDFIAPSCNIDGLNFDYTYTASLTNAGNAKNEFTVTIYDDEGKVANDNYNIIYRPGTLVVHQKQLILKSESKSWVYDGSMLQGLESDCYIEMGYSLASNDHIIEFYPTASIIDAGVVNNDFVARIRDTLNNEDVTQNYSITYVCGKLEVTKAEIIINSISDSKYYDATELRSENDATGYYVDGDLRNPDAQENVTFTASITNVGTTLNTFDVVIIANGMDISENYVITKNYGTLRIIQKPIYITSHSKTEQYSGRPLVPSNYYIDEMYEIYSGGLVENSGHYIRYSSSASITDVGSVLNVFDAEIYDVYGNPVTDNYYISKNFGTLTITPINIQCVSDYMCKYYDGTPLVGDASHCKLGDNSTLANNDVITFYPTGSITDAGKILNTFYATVFNTERNVDVTTNYNIGYTPNYLEVLPVRITISTSNGEHTYNGDEYYLHEYNGDVENKLLPGHEILDSNIVFASSSVITNVGYVNNAIVPDSIVVVDRNNYDEDVTKNYTFDFVNGILQVTPRDLVVTTHGYSWIYDGDEHWYHKYEIGADQLLESIHRVDRVEFASTTKLKNVGTALNSISVFNIVDNDTGKSVNANYNIIHVSGTVEIKARPINIIPFSEYAVYDGNAHYCHDFKVDDNTPLVAEHTIKNVSFSPNSTLINAGKVDNVINSLSIFDGDIDVTNNYDIDLSDHGTITVDKRPITIRSNDASKTYDSTPLVCNAWSIVSLTQPVQGHVVNVAISGTRTEAGESENFIAEVMITAKDENQNTVNVTGNYDITKQHGALVVKSVNAPESEKPKKNGVLDTGGSVKDGGDADDVLFFNVYSDKKETVYLRLMSYGDYVYDAIEDEWHWDSAKAYDKVLTINGNDYSYNYLTGLAIHNSDIESSRISIESFMANQYYVPYFPDTYSGIYKIPTSDVVNEYDDSDMYTVYCYRYSGYGNDLSLPDEYTYLEEEYRNFVYLNYRSVDTKLSNYMQAIIDANIDVSSPTLISDVASYIKNAAIYDSNYNKSIDDGIYKGQDYEHPIIAFLEAKQGVCRHYASAATALFRTLGIPARYTGGVVAYTKAGEWTPVYSDNAHAWVEIYIDGIGWMPVEVTGSSLGNNDNDNGDNDNDNDDNDKTKNALTLTPKTVYYHASSEIPTEFSEVTGMTSWINKGYRCVATIKFKDGKPTSPGIYALEIEDYILYDSNNQDVTDQFQVQCKVGYLQVYIEELTVKTQSASKVYNGTPLKNDYIEYTGNLKNGHRVETLTCKGEQTNVGTSTNTFNIKIVDENNLDVTSHYKINKIYGSLTVEPIVIKITTEGSGSDPIVFDPDNPVTVTNSNYTVEVVGNKGNIDDYTIDVTTNGAQTNPGYSENTVSKVVIKNAQGIDITSNFKLEYNLGILEVKPPQIQYT